MASKTLNQFTPSATVPENTDYIVGYTAPIFGGERRWTVNQLKEALIGTDPGGGGTPLPPGDGGGTPPGGGGGGTTLVPTGTDLPESPNPIGELGFIKFLAKQAPSRNSGAAVTTTNRVIAWGLLNGTNGSSGGHLAPVPVTGSAIEPMQYVRVPFYSSWSQDNGADGVDYLDENPALRVVDLYWTTRVGFALLSDGSAWVTGLNNGGIGLGTGPAAAASRPTCGFVRLSFPGIAAGAVIKRIQCASDNSTSLSNNDTVFCALDTTNTLWMWGRTLDGVFGTTTATGTVDLHFPTKITNRQVVIDNIGTTVIENFESRILDFSITGCESTGTAISIVRDDNTLWLGGDNVNYTRGAGMAAAVRIMHIWNKALKPGNVPISDALYVERTFYSGRLNHFYTDTNGDIWACGTNLHGTLGSGGTANTYTSRGYFTQVLLPNGFKAVTTEPSVFMTGNTVGTVYALCKNTTTNVQVLFSWGYNGAVGYCGVDSTANIITTPTICKYRTVGGNKIDITNVSKVFISDQTGSSSNNFGAVAVIDVNSYAYSAGYGNFNDPPTYSNNNRQFFIRLPLKNVKEITLGSRADIITHSWTLILQKSGAVWGMGDVASKLFGSADVAKHPLRLL